MRTGHMTHMAVTWYCGVCSEKSNPIYHTTMHTEIETDYSECACCDDVQYIEPVCPADGSRVRVSVW